MELSVPELAPLLILSEGEIYFLKVIVPILLLLPWVVALFFFIIRWILRYFASLKPKEKPPLTPIVSHNENANLYPDDQAPKLKEIEELAKSQPRLAVIELSKFIRIVNLSRGYERLSLEFFLKDSNKKKFSNWTDLLSEKTRSNLKEPQDLFAEIVLASYQLEEPTTAIALKFVERVRGLKTKSKDKTT